MKTISSGRKIKRIISWFLVFLLAPFLLFGAEYSGKVVSVIDGDTIHVLFDTSVPSAKLYKDGTVSVRLRGIDAPEKDQPFGKESGDMLASMVQGKMVSVKAMDIDRYGRLTGYVFCGGKNINLEQVKAGMAWSYKKYLDRPYVSEFYDFEQIARKSRLGLWQQNNPIPPWEWRKSTRTD